MNALVINVVPLVFGALLPFGHNCTVGKYDQVGKNLANILPPPPLSNISLALLHGGLKFAFFQCSMAYIALAVPLRRPRKVIQHVYVNITDTIIPNKMWIFMSRES